MSKSQININRNRNIKEDERVNNAYILSDSNIEADSESDDNEVYNKKDYNEEIANVSNNQLLYKEEDLAKEGQEIYDILSPKFQKLKMKEKQLDSLTSKAKSYIVEYKKSNEVLAQLIKKNKQKKEKFQKFAERLNSLRTELKQREDKLNLKEKEIIDYESSLSEANNKILLNREKFDIYFEKKSKELINKADEVKQKLQNFTKLQELLDKREKEIEKKIAVSS